MARFEVITRVDLDLKSYPPGSFVEIDDTRPEVVDPLLSSGAIKPADPADPVNLKSAKDVVAQVAAAETVEAVDALIQGDTRKSVITAADNRRAELTAQP